jgi:hypothetical protein
MKRWPRRGANVGAKATCIDCTYGVQRVMPDSTLKRCCVRFPPQPLALYQGNAVGIISAWPTVGDFDCCGEFVPQTTN